MGACDASVVEECPRPGRTMPAQSMNSLRARATDGGREEQEKSEFHRDKPIRIARILSMPDI